MFLSYPDSQILAGRQLPPECHTELHTDYGGAAVRWGLTHHKESAYDCCEACLSNAKNAKEGEKRCNIWVYCPSEGGCYSPDKYEHKHQECWLKYVCCLLLLPREVHSVGCFLILITYILLQICTICRPRMPE